MIDTELSNIFSGIAKSIRGKGVEGTFKPSEMSQAIDNIKTSGGDWERPSDCPRIDLIDVSEREQVIWTVDTQCEVDKPWAGFRVDLKDSKAKWYYQELDVQDDGTYTVLSSTEFAHTASLPPQWITDNRKRYRVFRITSSLSVSGGIKSIAWNESPVCTENDNQHMVGLTLNLYRCSFIVEVNSHLETVKNVFPYTSFSYAGQTYPKHLINYKCRFDNYYGWWNNTAAEEVDIINPNFVAYHTSGQIFGGVHNAKHINIKITDPNWKMTEGININGICQGNYNLRDFDMTWLSGYKSLNGNWANMFNGCTQLADIKGLNDINTSTATTFYGAFIGCKSLRTLDLHNWHYSNVTSLAAMFNGCASLDKVDLGHIEECQNVTTTQSMFMNCNSLKELDLHNMISPKCTNFQQMFSTCYNLNWLDISSLDFSKATNLSNMFYGCTYLKVVKWTTDITKGIGINFDFSASTSITHDTIIGLLNILQDLNGKTAQKLTLGKTNLNKLTADEKAIATNKNWTLV